MFNSYLRGWRPAADACKCHLHPLPGLAPSIELKCADTTQMILFCLIIFVLFLQSTLLEHDMSFCSECGLIHRRMQIYLCGVSPHAGQSARISILLPQVKRDILELTQSTIALWTIYTRYGLSMIDSRPVISINYPKSLFSFDSPIYNKQFFVNAPTRSLIIVPTTMTSLDSSIGPLFYPLISKAIYLQMHPDAPSGSITTNCFPSDYRSISVISKPIHPKQNPPTNQTPTEPNNVPPHPYNRLTGQPSTRQLDRARSHKNHHKRLNHNRLRLRSNRDVYNLRPERQHSRSPAQTQHDRHHPHHLFHHQRHPQRNARERTEEHVYCAV